MVIPPSVQDFDAPTDDEIIGLISYINTWAFAIQQYADYLLQMNIGDAEALEKYSDDMQDVLDEIATTLATIRFGVIYVDNKELLRRLMDIIMPKVATTLFYTSAQAHTTPWMPWFGWWQPIPAAPPGQEWYPNAPGNRNQG